ncbi:phosphatidylglycerophosphatase A family protein [Salinarimonas ramus]|uniref:YutG/PgpA domain-containing protein n=1 Tax=Salinarimonas ramus TaxID=690164 RepID=A0A917Q4T9_9HYPH|nr:phosphatidylglycerophosphatase A [Salinarimonas ramus]GGK22416.1 hypothetical protein GCM10011322_06370 [Salinarimonas ramus]
MLWLGHAGTARVALAVGMTAPFLWWAQRLAPWTRAAIGAALFAMGLWASAAWSAATGLVDDGRIVVDEVAGAALVLFVLRPKRPSIAAAVLVAYVAIDRLKPWPVSLAESIPGAFGVMLDDIAAAGLAVVLALLGRLVLRRLG